MCVMCTITIACEVRIISIFYYNKMPNERACPVLNIVSHSYAIDVQWVFCENSYRGGGSMTHDRGAGEERAEVTAV